jgi:hypothetical protein
MLSLSVLLFFLCGLEGVQYLHPLHAHLPLPAPSQPACRARVHPPTTGVVGQSLGLVQTRLVCQAPLSAATAIVMQWSELTALLLAPQFVGRVASATPPVSAAPQPPPPPPPGPLPPQVVTTHAPLVLSYTSTGVETRSSAFLQRSNVAPQRALPIQAQTAPLMAQPHVTAYAQMKLWRHSSKASMSLRLKQCVLFCFSLGLLVAAAATFFHPLILLTLNHPLSSPLPKNV